MEKDKTLMKEEARLMAVVKEKRLTEEGGKGEEEVMVMVPA